MRMRSCSDVCLECRPQNSPRAVRAPRPTLAAELATRIRTGELDERLPELIDALTAHAAAKA